MHTEDGAKEMLLGDAYTLVVPTYNRPEMLTALLRYLERSGAAFQVLVLDSSAEAYCEANRDAVSSSALRIRHVECDESILPFEKFLAGVTEVQTPFCGLCADDDLIIVDGVRRCVEYLQEQADAGLAHGYYFSFLDHGGAEAGMDVVDIPYYAPGIDSPDPVARLRQLFLNYQALTYATYRTPVLRYILARARGVGSILGRELLSSALAVVKGKAARLGCFTNGRNRSPSEPYAQWHPLEWFLRSTDGLFAEYLRYREMLIDELLSSPGYGRTREATQRIVDVAHMAYFVRHVPIEAQEFILDHVLAEKDVQDFWAADEIQVPLVRASRYRSREGWVGPDPARDIPRWSPGGEWPRQLKTQVRSYRLHEGFSRPDMGDLITFGEEEVSRLLEALDNYGPGDGRGQPPLQAHRQEPAVLIKAAADGDAATVRRMLDTGDYDRGALDRALRAAAAQGHLRVVRLLHERGADLRSEENAALRVAASRGHLSVVKYLHARGANIQARDDEAVRRAAAGGHGEVVSFLHRNGSAPLLLSPHSRNRIEEMMEEIRSAREIYHPSRFWEFFIDTNNNLLNRGAERNFKRTVNQNYFNFVPTSLIDPKIVNLLRLWPWRSPLKPFRYRMEDPDQDPNVWLSWYREYFVFGGPHRLRMWLYKIFVGCLYEYALRTDRHGVLTRMEEPRLGNPIRVFRDRRLVSQDLVNSVLERNALVEALDEAGATGRPRVAELGAGYGRLGYVLLSSTTCRYLVFDIPPALHVSEWYLSRLFPERRLFRFRRFQSFSEIEAELQAADIAFFTANQLELLPDGFVEAFATISSLHEMRPEQIAHFLDLMAAKTKHAIYLRQHCRYVNPFDNLVVKQSDYPLPKGWRVAADRPDEVNPGFFERVLSPR